MNTQVNDQTEPIIESKPVPVHYVDNKKFLEALNEYRAQVLEAKEKGLEKPTKPGRKEKKVKMLASPWLQKTIPGIAPGVAPG